ncbi:MAG: hypothetical protein AAFP84_05315 [Actinomycetota bacterium]
MLHTRGASGVTRRRLIGGGLAAATAVGVSRFTSAADVGPIDGFAVAGHGGVRIDPPEPTPAGTYDPRVLYVALYGHPGSPGLGVLGERSPEGSAAVARQIAAGYEGFGRPVVPCFELIGSVASAGAGGDGDYSNEFPTSTFQPWIDVAAANGFHVMLDLQSGRSRFPDQAREYEEVIAQPQVSLALDPEWRGDAPFRPGGGRVGTVDAAEVNETIDWLDALIVRRNLPAKLLIVHQFTPSMITNKAAIRGTPRVQVMLHMDGFGSLELKRASFDRMLVDLPAGAVVGWKNFFDEDRPTPTPAQTMAARPAPSYVSFQ